MRQLNRRDFMRTSALLSTTAYGTACGSAAAKPVAPPPSFTLTDGATIVFQGDSVTDSNRNAVNSDPNVAISMGYGYPLFIAQRLLLANPGKQLRIFNRARGGDTVPLLQSRWQTDTIALQPDLLSILIGLNDFVADHTSATYASTFEANYKALIDTTRQALPRTQIVIVEPYAITDNTPVPEFQPIRDAAARVATYANAIYVPIHDMLNQHVNTNGHAYWFDEQHPTIAGSAAIADKWLSTVGI